MLRFAENFEETGTYKGVQLNRARVLTRGKTQARLDEYGVCQTAEEDNTTVAAVLFCSLNFYVDAVTNALNERFSVFKEEPYIFS